MSREGSILLQVIQPMHAKIALPRSKSSSTGDTESAIMNESESRFYAHPSVHLKDQLQYSAHAKVSQATSYNRRSC